MELAITLGSVFLFFLAYLGLQQLVRIPCALCAAVSSTWAISLIATWHHLLPPAITTLLMGQSITGIMYLLQNRLGRYLLPFGMTLTWAAYAVVTLSLHIEALAFIIMLWTVFAIAGINKDLVERIIACCRDW